MNVNLGSGTSAGSTQSMILVLLHFVKKTFEE